MSGSVNKVILVGNLARDPEIRNLGQDGAQVANLRLMTNESWKDKSTGERRQRSEGHDIVVFNEALIRTIRDYCKKGMQLYIEGSLQTRKWQDKDGNDRYSTEVVLQRYRGELTMLSRADDDSYDSRGGGDDQGSRETRGGGERGGGDRGGYRDGGSGGRGGQRDDRGGRGGGGGREQTSGRGGFDADLDDDVPF